MTKVEIALILFNPHYQLRFMQMMERKFRKYPDIMPRSLPRIREATKKLHLGGPKHETMQ